MESISWRAEVESSRFVKSFDFASIDIAMRSVHAGGNSLSVLGRLSTIFAESSSFFQASISRLVNPRGNRFAQSSSIVAPTNCSDRRFSGS